MERPPVPAGKLCHATKADGTACKVAMVPGGSGLCIFHSPREKKGECVPSLTLAELSDLDLSNPDGIALARRCIWQHLLAGSVAPHVAKVALDVAESVHRNARPKSDGKRSAMADVMESVMGTKPPQQDE